MRLEFTPQATAFLDRAGGYLAARPVVATVLLTVAERLRALEVQGVDDPEWPAEAPRWFLTVLDDAGQVAGVAMRTAPFSPYPAFVLPMPDPAARELARTLHGRGEELLGVNGALPAARIVADETARLVGGSARVAMHTRLFELIELVTPEPVPGGLRPVRDDELDIVVDWLAAFTRDADEQAGREPGSHPEVVTAADLARRVSDGRLQFWQVDGRPVCLTGTTTPAYGVTRLGPVYTPPELRGRGYASAAVAAVSAGLLARGVGPCLYTDQANPTSNRIYQALGYRPVVDQANHVIDVPRPGR